MKSKILHITLFSLLIILYFACEKEDTVVAPSVQTASVDEILNTSARVGGKVSADGGADVSDRGVYWGTSTNPETSGTKLSIGNGVGIFYSNLTGLTSGVKYYVKAYASNSKGTDFGNETFFTTQISFPTVTTAQASEQTISSAKIGGNVTDDGGYEVTQRGVYWGAYANPRITGEKLVIGSGEGAFSQTLNNLELAITYHTIAFATNIKGTAFGEEITFSTLSELPVVYTAVIADITTNSVTVGGNVNSTGGTQVTERGIYWSTSADAQTTGTKLVIGSGAGSFYSTLSSLSPGVKYYIKAFATNSNGTAYGEEKYCTTLGEIPTATTLQADDIRTTSVTLYGLVNANDLSTTVSFEYGTSAAYGNSIDATDSPTTADGDSVSVSLTGLISETTYHFRVKAVNELGTTYGADSVFTTVLTGITGSVDDNDGNTYQTIGIGHQIWMTRNLRTTKYNDGTKIPVVKADTSWAKLATPGYNWYNKDSIGYCNTYGAVYNWYTVNTSKLCPSGWHVPTNDDFTELIDYLGSASVAGGKLKESGTAHWDYPNTGANNEVGFNAFAGGKRLDDGTFDFLKVEGSWWSSSNYSTQTASYLYILNNYSNSFQAYINKKYGMSVRCVKN